MATKSSKGAHAGGAPGQAADTPGQAPGGGSGNTSADPGGLQPAQFPDGVTPASSLPNWPVSPSGQYLDVRETEAAKAIDALTRTRPELDRAMESADEAARLVNPLGTFGNLPESDALSGAAEREAQGLRAQIGHLEQEAGVTSTEIATVLKGYRKVEEDNTARLYSLQQRFGDVGQQAGPGPAVNTGPGPAVNTGQGR